MWYNFVGGKIMVKNQDIKLILDKLEENYPDAECALVHQNVYQLIVAVALSAQTTDKSVNLITPNLFYKYPTAADLAVADVSEVEDCIRRIGMYKTKAKNIVGMAKALVEKHGGQVP
jgi:endonuclease-3